MIPHRLKVFYWTCTLQKHRIYTVTLRSNKTARRRMYWNGTEFETRKRDLIIPLCNVHRISKDVYNG